VTRSELEAARLRGIALVVLAFGVSIALVGLAVAVIYDARRDSGISDNARQFLIAAFSGLVAVAGAWIGFRAGAASRPAEKPWPGETDAETREIKR
jgi:zinc transporter ZupT